MKTVAVDTNVLIYAHVPASPQHAPSRQALLRLLGDDGTRLALAPLVIHEFLHVLTDPMRVTPLVAMSEAVGIVRAYLNRSNVLVVPTTESALTIACDLVDRHGLGRQRLSDALLAATLLDHGIPALLTYNVGDFRYVEGLACFTPEGEHADA